MAKPDNIKNLLSESEGLAYLREIDKDLILLSLVNLPNIYSRSFDLVKLKVNSFEDIKSRNDFILVEVKVTKKYLINFPKGFFLE